MKHIETITYNVPKKILKPKIYNLPTINREHYSIINTYLNLYF